MSQHSLGSHQQHAKTKFRLIAHFYDLFDLPFILDKRTNPRLALARRIPNKPLHILDMCTGTAIASITVAQANPDNRIVGIDLSPDMLTIADAKLSKKHVQNVSLRQMNAARMTFRDGAFDACMVSFGLHEMNYEAMVTVLKEMHRVLRDGGSLFIVDYARQGGPFINMLFSVYLKVFEPKRIFEFLKHDWNSILKDTGFHVVNVDQCFFAKLISAAKTN